MNNILSQPFSWSYSRLNNFNTCPRRYNEIDVLKNFKEEQSSELRDGFLVHEAMARRISRDVPLPPNMPFEKWAAYAMEGLNENSFIGVEQRLAMTQGFEKCDYFDKKKLVWLRTVADVLRIDGDRAHIIDWKTGKVKPDLEQLILIASCVMAHHPKVTSIKAELVWLAYDTSTVKEYTVDEIVNYWGDTLLEKVQRLKVAHQTNNFPPNRSGLCQRWCVVTSCEHCGQ